MSELSNEPTLNEQIGTLSGDTPLGGDGSLGELTFDSVHPGVIEQPKDPMESLHMPTLKSQNTTTVTVDGVEVDASGSAPKGITAFAKKFIGTPYVWGGTSPSGFDCSGFVQYVYAHFGKKLPRISADQARAGKRIALGAMRPGDLVAWDNSSRNNGADHIAIYLGNGLLIEAPRPGASVRISHLYDTGRAWGVRL
jgi:cell wall-associated NlpC family hydrolase